MSDSNSSLTIRVGTSGIASAMSEFKALSGVIAGLAPALAALTSVGGFAALATAGLSMASEMTRMRQVVGATIQDMTGLAYAGNRVDISTSQMTVGLKKFSEYLVKTGQNGKSMKQALLEQSAIFQAMPDGVEKTARAVQLFGRSGAAMIPLLNQGPVALQAMIERGGELSGVTDAMGKNAKEFGESLKDLKLASEGLAASLISPLLPSITGVLLSVTDGMVKFREWAKASDTFRISVEALSVALGVMASIKIGSIAIAGLGAFIGAGAITSISGFIAALQLLPLAFLAAATAAAPLALAIAGITGLVMIGVTWWQMYKAKQEEALSAKNAQGAMTAYGAAIQRNIDAQVKVGSLGGEQGDAMKRNVTALTIEWEKGNLTLDEYRKRLDGIATTLRDTNPAQASAASGPERPDDDLNTLRHSGRELELARMEAAAAIRKAAIETEVKENDELYQKKLISVQDYYTKKRQLDEANEASERALLQKKLAAVSEDLKVNDSEQKFAMADPGTDNSKVIQLEQKRNSLLGEQAKLMGQIGVLDTQNAAQDAINAAKQAADTVAQNLRLDEQAKKIAELKYANAKSAIEGSPDMSEQQKATAMLAVNQAQQAYIAAQIRANELDAQSAKSQDDKNKYTQLGLELQGQSVALQNQQQHLLAQSGNWAASFKEAAAGCQQLNQNLSQMVAGGALNLLQQGVHGMASAFTNVIMGTKSLGKAMSQLGEQMLSSFISMILDIAMEALIVIPLLTALGVLSGGTIPAAGAGATVASVASAQAGVGAMLFAAEGGLVRGPGSSTSDSINARLSDMEYVMPASAVKRVGVPAMDAIRSGAPVSGGGSDARSGSPVNLHFYDSRPHPKDFLASSEGENMVVNIARKNRLKIGVGT